MTFPYRSNPGLTTRIRDAWNDLDREKGREVMPNYATVRSHKSGWHLDWYEKVVRLVSKQTESGITYTETEELVSQRIEWLDSVKDNLYKRQVEYGK